MTVFNSLIHGDALAQILMEGHNPYALQKLETADVDALRQAMQTGEALQAYGVGRIVMSGRGVWAVTERAVLLRDASQQGVHLAFQARGVASQFEDKQADSPFWRSSEAAAQDCLQDARGRLQAA